MIRALALAALLCAPAMAHDGAYKARFLRAVDGDTAVFRIDVPEFRASFREAVRIQGVDTPEIRGECEAEKIGAQAARRRLAELLTGASILLRTDGRDRYGRLLARVEADGEDVAETLVREGHGRPYGGEQREDWCG